MTEVRACRVCLARDGRMDPPEKHRLHRAYETLIGSPLVEECGMPQWLCAECAHSLRKWSAFRSRCRRASAMLRAIYDTHMQITEEEIAKVDRRATMLMSPLVVRQLVPIVIEQCFETTGFKDEESTAGHLEPQIMLEILLPIKEEVKAEFSPPPSEPDHYDMDSLKDEPLIIDGNLKESESNTPKEVKARTAKSGAEIKAKTQPVKRAKKKKPKKFGRKEIYPRSFYEEFATVTTLTREQQLEDIEKRRATDNYNKSPFQCTLCYLGFIEDATFKNHMMKHDPANGDHECDICRRRFRLARLLRQHVNKNHSHRYSCRRCEHVCSDSTQARLHEDWHKGKRYQCPHCDQSLLKFTSYMSHLRKKHTSRFVCELCGNAFVSEKGILQHKSLAHKHQKIALEGPFCVECDMRFASEEAFTVHLNSSAKHNFNKNVSLANVRPNIDKFKCDDCGDAFARKNLLVLHMKCKHRETREDGASKSAYGSECDVHISRDSKHGTDNGIKDESSEGGTMLESKAEMTIHCRSHDQWVRVDTKREGNIECNQCDAMFLTNRAFYSHFKRKHPGIDYPKRKTVVCEICGQHWPSVHSLVSHQQTHAATKPLQCPRCPLSFGARHVLDAHMRTHTGEKPFACPRCPKRFRIHHALKIHERTHSGERPFPCDICAKAFKIKSAVNRHMLVHTGVKSYECERCGKAFSQLSAVKLHVRTVHLKLPAPPRNKRRKKQPPQQTVEMDL